jgi:hypothetical protein
MKAINAQRSTPNAQRPITEQMFLRWTLGIGRWALSVFVLCSLLLAPCSLLASYNLFSVVDFGAGRSGLSTVGYKVYTQSSNTLGSRITTGVQEIGATGKYGAVVTFPDGFVGGVLWDSGETVAVYAMDVQNPQTGEYVDAKVSSRSTYAGTDTSGTTTLLSRVTSTRAGNLDNLDAAVSSRSTYAGGAVASVTANVNTNANATETAIKAKTDNLPASPAATGDIPSAADTAAATAAQITSDHGTGSYVEVTSDSAGVTTLLGRLTSTRAGLLDHLNADVTSRMATFSLPSNFSSLSITSGGKVDLNDKTGFSLTSAYDPAKVDIWGVTLPGSYTGQKAGNLLWRVGNKP